MEPQDSDASASLLPSSILSRLLRCTGGKTALASPRSHPEMSSRQRARRLADRIAKAVRKVDGLSSKCTELRLLYNESALMTPLDPASTAGTELARQKAATSNALSTAESADAQAGRARRSVMPLSAEDRAFFEAADRAFFEAADSGSGHGSSSSAEESGSGSEE